MTDIHVPHTGRQPGQVPEARDEAARVHGPRVHRPAHQAVSADTRAVNETIREVPLPLTALIGTLNIRFILSAEVSATRVRG